MICLGGYFFRLKAEDAFFSRYNFCHITEESGLPNNSVTSVIKDSFGYIWIATQDGLARYDGYRFLIYGVKEPVFRLKGNYVYALCEDRQKRLWVGSDAGLDLIDLQTGCHYPCHGWVERSFRDFLHCLLLLYVPLCRRRMEISGW